MSKVLALRDPQKLRKLPSTADPLKLFVLQGSDRELQLLRTTEQYLSPSSLEGWMSVCSGDLVATAITGLNWLFQSAQCLPMVISLCFQSVPGNGGVLRTQPGMAWASSETSQKKESQLTDTSSQGNR